MEPQTRYVPEPIKAPIATKRNRAAKSYEVAEEQIAHMNTGASVPTDFPPSEFLPLITIQISYKAKEALDAWCKRHLHWQENYSDAMLKLAQEPKGTRKRGRPPNKPKPAIDVLTIGSPRSIRDTLHKVIETVSELQKETGTVDESLLVQVLVEREKIEEAESKRLIRQLVKEGVLYCPVPNKLKTTKF